MPPETSSKEVWCRFCEIRDEKKVPAVYLAPQSEEATLRFKPGSPRLVFWRWLPVCESHFNRWFLDGDDGKVPYFLIKDGH